MTRYEVIKLFRRRTVKILGAYFYDGLTHLEISKKHRISRVRVTQIIQKAVLLLEKHDIEAPKRFSSGRVYSFDDTTLNRLSSHSGTYRWEKSE